MYLSKGLLYDKRFFLGMLDGKKNENIQNREIVPRLLSIFSPLISKQFIVTSQSDEMGTTHRMTSQVLHNCIHTLSALSSTVLVCIVRKTKICVYFQCQVFYDKAISVSFNSILFFRFISYKQAKHYAS